MKKKAEVLLTTYEHRLIIEIIKDLYPESQSAADYLKILENAFSDHLFTNDRLAPVEYTFETLKVIIKILSSALLKIPGKREKIVPVLLKLIDAKLTLSDNELKDGR